jgi:hypothetical protein
MVAKRSLDVALDSPCFERLDAERQRSLYARKVFGQRQSLRFVRSNHAFRNECDIVRTCRHRHETFRNVRETRAVVRRGFET